MHFVLLFSVFLLVLVCYFFNLLEFLIQLPGLLLDLLLQLNLSLNFILELSFDLEIGQLVVTKITDFMLFFIHLRKSSEVLGTGVADAPATIAAEESFLC